MRKVIMACVLGLMAAPLVAQDAQAQAIACGGEYTVVRGDTLQGITNRAYTGRSYQVLYSANREAIGRNPGLIEVGLTLQIPCLDGEVASTAPTTTVTQPQTTGVIPAPKSHKLRVVTATDWAPFLNQGEENGGMLTEVTNVALARVLDEKDYKIDFVNDWSAHLQPLISDVAYDFSLAWFRPNCDVIEKLGEGSQFRCRNLDWSDPLFEQIIGYYTRASETSQPSTHADLLGRTICRPAGYSTFMMEEKDLVEPNIKIESPAGPTECFQMLVEGQVDAVVLATTVADDAIAGLDVGSLVAEQPQLATVATLHAVTSINNPNKDEQLATLNEGLRQIREDGKWFEIVQRHLIAHAKATATN